MYRFRRLVLWTITLTTIEDVVEPIVQIQIGCRTHIDLFALIITTIMEMLLGSLILDSGFGSFPHEEVLPFPHL